MPEISVIVPVYNVEKYLKRCVDSILKQSFTDFELILVDDGSTDASCALCDNYAESDSRVRVLHQPNGGAAAARNAGLDFVFSQSNSEWITFVDGDDWVHRCYLQYLYSTVKENCLDIAICKSVKVYNETMALDVDDAFSVQVYSSDDFWAKDIMSACGPWAKIYSKQLWKGIRFPEGKHCEDLFVIHTILFQFEKLSVIAPPLYYYYYHSGSTSNSMNWLQKMDHLEALTEQSRFFKNNKFPKAEATASRSLFYEIVNALKVLIAQHPSEKQTIRRLRRQLRMVQRNHRQSLNLQYGNGKSEYIKFAHPVYYKLNKKRKHLLSFFTKTL